MIPSTDDDSAGGLADQDDRIGERLDPHVRDRLYRRTQPVGTGRLGQRREGVPGPVQVRVVTHDVQEAGAQRRPGFEQRLVHRDDDAARRAGPA